MAFLKSRPSRASKAQQTADRSVCRTTRRPLPVRAQASSAVSSPLRSRSSVEASAAQAAAVLLMAAQRLPKRVLRQFAAAIASGFANRASALLPEQLASLPSVGSASLAGRQRAAERAIASAVLANSVAQTVAVGRLRSAKPCPEGKNGHFARRCGRLRASNPVARVVSANRAAPHPLRESAAGLRVVSLAAFAPEQSAPARRVAAAGRPNGASARQAQALPGSAKPVTPQARAGCS